MDEEATGGSEGSGSDQGVAFTCGGLVRGMRRAAPMAAGVVAFGLVFGLLARQAGLSVAETTLMSALVFAGSSQLVALSMWGPALPVLAIVATTLLVNLRHVLMGLTLRPWYAPFGRRRAYGSYFFMTDESWALTTVEFRSGARDGAFMVGAGLVLFVAWVTSSAVGRATGAAIRDPARWGLDFAFAAAFLALLTSLARGRSDVVPWMLAAGTALVANRWLPGSWYVLLGGLAGALPAAVGRRRA